MSNFTIEHTSISGVRVMARARRADGRGFLERLFDDGELQPVLTGRRIAQVNRTNTQKAGTLRGMHLQVPPAAELKIVSCLRGSVFDVAVDLRPNSATFGSWFGCELTSNNGLSLVLPEGCAHGVQALVDDCDLLYIHTALHMPGAERGLHPIDPDVAIAWPLEPTELSARDAALPNLWQWR